MGQHVLGDQAGFLDFWRDETRTAFKKLEASFFRATHPPLISADTTEKKMLTKKLKDLHLS